MTQKQVLGIVLTTAAASLALSWIGNSNDTVINTDGILYVRAAAEIQAGDWTAAVATYNWPAFPACIAAWSSKTGLGLEAAARQVGSGFDAIAAVAFLALAYLLGARGKTLLFAAAAILLFPTVNKYRPYVIRDHGYVAGYLTAACCLLAYSRQRRWAWALGWGVAMVAASLFRVEGLLFLVLVPFVFLLQRGESWRTRWLDLLRTSTVFLVGAVGLTVAWVTAEGSTAARLAARSQIRHPIGYFKVLFETLTEGFPEKAEHVAEHVLHRDAEAYGPWIVLAAVGLIFCVEIVKALNPLYACFVLHGRFSARESWLATEAPARHERARGRRVWGAFVALNLALLLVMAMLRFNLTGRAAVPLALTLLVWVPFSWNDLYVRWKSRRGLPFQYNFLFPLVAVLVVASGVAGAVRLGPSKTHIRTAGTWLEENLPAQAEVFTNDFTLSFYAGRPQAAELRGLPWRNAVRTFEAAKKKKPKAPRALAIRVKRKRPKEKEAVLKRVGRKPVQEFASPRGDTVLVFSDSLGTTPKN